MGESVNACGKVAIARNKMFDIYLLVSTAKFVLFLARSTNSE